MTPPISDIYVELGERMAAWLGSSRVRALHLPPLGLKATGFCALELEDGSIGFSYIQLEGVEAPLRERGSAPAVAGVPAVDLARGFASNDPVDRALGFAALNALSQQLFTRANWEPPANDDSLGAIVPQRGEHIGMIGLFMRLIPAIESAGARLTVLELNPALVRDEPNYRVTLDPAELAHCDPIISTCTILLNDTLDDVLAAGRNARHFAVVGPTASCVPDPLFARGIDSLGGRRVTEQEGFVAAFTSGKKWGAHTSKYVLTRENYPGIDWLLARVR